MKKLIFPLVLIMLAVQTSYSQRSKKSSKERISDPIEVKLDNIAFDENAYMSVLDGHNNVVAYYSRVENNSCSVKSVEVFNLHNELVYTLVPVITNQGFEIHIRNGMDVRGYVKTTARLAGIRVAHDTEVNYFQKPYDFEIKSNIRFGKVGSYESVKFDNRTVMSYQMAVSLTSGFRETPFIVSKEFFADNKLDVANWMLIFLLKRELSYAMAFAQLP